MVSKVEEAMKRKQQPQQQEHSKVVRREYSYQQQIQCNKGKVNKFKRSSSSLEEDGISSAILLLACIACAPSY